MIISRSRVDAAICHIPSIPLVYLQNAKVACSSIKKALWVSKSNSTFKPDQSPHEKDLSPFCKTLDDVSLHLDSVIASRFFTVVRNPYTRILSAYLDKVGREPRDPEVWLPFARRYRLAKDARPSFQHFLHLVTSEDPNLLDQHFAPQCVNVLHTFVTCDYVGHIENMAAVWEFLAGFGIAPNEHRPHKTLANEALGSFYGREEVANVQNFFQRDFEAFGYSDDLSVTEPVRALNLPARPRHLIRALISSYTADHRDSRSRCIQAIAREVPDLVVDYNELEAGTMTVERVQALAELSLRGEILNWKLVSRVGQELLRYDMVREAQSVLGRAVDLMYSSDPLPEFRRPLMSRVLAKLTRRNPPRMAACVGQVD
jgi:hypothetical protein